MYYYVEKGYIWLYFNNTFELLQKLLTLKRQVEYLPPVAEC